MRATLKKTLSILLVLAVVNGTVPVSILTVMADEATEFYDVTIGAEEEEGVPADIISTDDGDEEMLISSSPEELPSSYDMRDYGIVTPVKSQNPWETCWAFGDIAAAETSILSAMGATYEETGLDLSEKHLAWYAYRPLGEGICNSQTGEGYYPIDENTDLNLTYNFAGANPVAGSVWATGIGPAYESDYPYRGEEGSLEYDDMIFRKDEWLEMCKAHLRSLYSAYIRLGSITEEDIEVMAEEQYQEELQYCKEFDYYSRFDDWTLMSDYTGGAEFTLTDNNIFSYYYRDEETWESVLDSSVSVSMKREMMNGLAVSTSIMWDESNVNGETGALYNAAGSSDHVVCIVGWDDDYPADNFLEKPPGDGAWLIKNSHGSETDAVPEALTAKDGTLKDLNRGQKGIRDEEGKYTGYYWLSYYDKTIQNTQTYTFDVSPNTDFTDALQYDFVPSFEGITAFNYRQRASMANIYPIDHDLCVTAVGARIQEDNLARDRDYSVHFELYCQSEEREMPDQGICIAEFDRHFDHPGYHRVRLDSPVWLKQGDRLSVVVTVYCDYGDGTGYYCCPATTHLSKKSRSYTYDTYAVAVVNPGESYLYADDSETGDFRWIDLAEPMGEEFYSNNSSPWSPPYSGQSIKAFYGTDNFCIKAFTKPGSLEHMEAVESSCEEPGNIEYWEDPETGMLFADENGVNPIEDVETEPTGHDWDEGKVTMESSTEKTGEMTYTCRKCETTRTEEIPKKELVSIEKASVGGVSKSYGYSGKAYEPAVTVKVGGKTLREDIDYTVQYADNKNPGNATITITGKGEYTGIRIKTFEIVDCASKIVDGKTYQLIPKNNSATAVCSFSGQMVNNTKVYITDRSSSEAMRFKAVRNSDGTWKFINAKCELALAVQQNSSEIGKGLVLYDQTTRKAQNWTLSKKFDNSFAIMNAVTGYSIAMSDPSAVKGTTLSMAETKSDGLQRFYIVETTPVKATYDGTKSVMASKDRKFSLNIASSSKADGANVNLYSYSSTNAKKFKIMYSGGGYYRLVNVNSGLVLTVKGNTKNDGTNVVQSKWAAESGQRWKIVKNSDGTVTLTNALGTNLHLSGNKTADGTNVIAKNTSTSTAQKWYLQ